MPILSQFLFLDPTKHPYIVVSGRGNQVARFSNLPCAARSVVLKKQKNPGTVLTPEGDVLDRGMCYTVIELRNVPSDYITKRPNPGTVALREIYESR